ncbi:MAG: efflux RND transporter periplasmic adaptor subunit [Flavobacteriales bacterium]
MKQSLKYISILAGGVVLGSILSPLFSSSDEHKTENKTEIMETETIWTCAMHPQIKANEPGLCPICAMDLTVLEQGHNNHDKEIANAIQMSPTAMQLASVTTQFVKEQDLEKSILLNGKIAVDQTRITTITAEIEGRIDELELTYEGEYVKKGQLIAQVYSPDLVVAQHELLEAQKSKDEHPEWLEIAKEKLKNWNITNSQINTILNQKTLIESFPIRSHVNGVIQKKRVNSGEHIKKGQTLFEISNLKSVWALFDVYEKDISWVKTNEEIEFTASSFPGKTFQGNISFIDPVVNEKSRTIQARVVLKNTMGKFKPGMFIQGSIHPKTTSKQGISVPKSAVMWTGKRSIVYIKNKTKNGVFFELRKVQIGEEIGDHYVILSGLKVGEEIAINGTFSIDAAAQLAGKPSMMNVDAGKTALMLEAEELKMELSDLSNWSVHFSEILNAYLSLKDALTEDDLTKAQTSGRELSKILKRQKLNSKSTVLSTKISELKKHIKTFNNTEDITESRRIFQPISNSIIYFSKHSKLQIETLFIHTCPMAVDNKEGEWLSTEKQIINPYMGAAMLKCGSFKEEIKSN